MQRVVLDTNVLISALLFGGPPAEIVRLVTEEQIGSVTSDALLAELRRVLLSKFQYPPVLADFIITEWKAVNEQIEPTMALAVITQDPSDNRVLECAVTGNVSVIISGDRHLLALKVFRSIPILSPQAYLTKRRSSP